VIARHRAGKRREASACAATAFRSLKVGLWLPCTACMLTERSSLYTKDSTSGLERRAMCTSGAWGCMQILVAMLTQEPWPFTTESNQKQNRRVFTQNRFDGKHANIKATRAQRTTYVTRVHLQQESPSQLIPRRVQLLDRQERIERLHNHLSGLIWPHRTAQTRGSKNTHACPNQIASRQNFRQ
jgi:hypothetical protein